MNTFAIYRLPHDHQFTLMEQSQGQPLELQSPLELAGRQGFVMAPFHSPLGEEPSTIHLQPSTIHHPPSTIHLLQPDRTTTFSSPDEVRSHIGHYSCHSSNGSRPIVGSRATYAADFATFHQALVDGRLRKVVLSRCAAEPNQGNISPVELFLRASQLYPRMFIALVSTPQSGTWLTATPEILLDTSNHQWRTIALAGTMQLDGDLLNGEGEQLDWSVKNIQEQRFVASYIADSLKHLGINYEETGPRTVRAANLVHLRSDFTFTIDRDALACQLLSVLHPTPAVCGLPKDEALRFITQHEHSPRLYYSGYMGPFHSSTIHHQPSTIHLPPSTIHHQPSTIHHQPSTINLPPSTINHQPSTHLFVSLRCMQIEPDNYYLFAGGGLLRESDEEREWQETESKLATMRSLLTP